MPPSMGRYAILAFGILGMTGFDGDGCLRIAGRVWLKLAKQGQNKDAEPQLALAA